MMLQVLLISAFWVANTAVAVRERERNAADLASSLRGPALASAPEHEQSALAADAATLLGQENFICPAERVAAPGEKRVLFVMTLGPQHGSMVMRGEMLAAALNQQAGWWAKAIQVDDEKHLFPDGSKDKVSRYSGVDVCVLVKNFALEAIQHCREQGALVVYDVVDDMMAISALQHGKLQEGVDMYLTSSTSLANVINAGRREPLAHKLAHQHSSRGWRMGEPTLPYACQVGILSGDKLNAPGAAQEQELVENICRSGKVGSVVFVTQTTNPSTVRREACTSATREMHETCSKQPQTWAQEPSTKTPTCFGNQDRYNSDPALAGVDLAFLWTPTGDANFMERPWTRMLFWAAHGVPVVFNKMHSYMEAKDDGYSAPSGQKLLVEHSAEDLAGVVGGLAGNLADRKALYEEGLHLAREYSTAGVGSKLSSLLATRLDAWSASTAKRGAQVTHRSWEDSPKTLISELTRVVRSYTR